MSTRWIWLFAVAGALLFAGLARGQVPHQINYQGNLTNPGGTPVNSAGLQMVLKLYDVATDGAALHSETQTVPVANGVFNVLVGAQPANPLTLPFDKPYWLGVTVATDAEMAPRQAVAAVGYAIRAANAEALAPGATVLASSVGIPTLTTSGAGGSPKLNVVADSAKAAVATTRALAVTTNDASSPFALDIRLVGAAALADRGVILQSTDWNAADGGNILLQPQGGNVGIGTASPTAAKLVVQTSAGSNGLSITDSNVNLFTRINASSAEFGTLSNHDLVFTTGGFTSVIIDAVAGNTFPTCDGCSSLGMSTKRWTTVFAQNGVIQTSDARLKKSVTNLDHGLSDVLQLRPVTFQWNDRSDGRTYVGLIAQEVERIIPEAVERASDPAIPLGLNYASLVPILISAVQEQQVTIAERAASLATLTAAMSTQTVRIAELEQNAIRYEAQLAEFTERVQKAETLAADVAVLKAALAELQRTPASVAAK